jgi:hypothetical protein
VVVEKAMANAMLKHDEFPTSSSSVDWLSMCASNSDNSMNNMTVNNPILVPMQPPPPLPMQPPPPPPQGNSLKQSYEKMIGITSPITITTTSILHPSSTNFITTDTLHTGNSNSNNNQSSNSNTLQQRKSVDFATLPPPSPKRIRQQIISLSMYSNNNHPKWNTKQIVDGTYSLSTPFFLYFVRSNLRSQPCQLYPLVL